MKALHLRGLFLMRFTLYIQGTYQSVGREETEMPATTFITLLACVILAAGLTIWALWAAGALGLAIALPLALIAAMTVRAIWR